MRFWVISFWVLSVAMASAEPPDRSCSSGKWGQVQCIRDAHFVHDTCQAIEIFADRHGLNRDFFARLIWQESRMDPNALSPADARGIAQFIPSTAKLRGLEDPYNPADALEHSAQYLAEMTDRFGNEGLAAVGYNGGERRVTEFIAGGGLAQETINYVPIITGLSAAQWRDDPPKVHDFRLEKDRDFRSACMTLAQNRRLSPLRIVPPPPDIKPWGVQIAFGVTKKAAREKVHERTRNCRPLIEREKLQLIYKKNRVMNRPGFQFVQIGRDDRAAAQDLCLALRRKGCLCLVIKN